LKEQKIFYSYFQVDQNYYLFVYAQQSIQLDLIYESIYVIQELDSKQRKIRSLRGFFLYALEIIENAQDYEILQTNLQPFFWRKVKNTIQQNKKDALLQFLFGKAPNYKSVSKGSSPHLQEMQDKIQNLQNQVHSLAQQVERLQQKIIQLEQNQNIVRETNLNVFSEAPKSPKIDSLTLEQGDYTLKGKKAPYLTENESEVRNPTYQPKDMESKSVSEASKGPLTPFSESQQYNISSTQYKGLNESNFITLGKISEEEKIEIIQLGFQLQAQGTISLKKYYESKDPNSLFQFKGYRIKYESIRRTKLYQNLKP
jgi:hypothetical protein